MSSIAAVPMPDALGTLRKELEKVVVGYDEVVEDLLVALVTGGHVLLEGVPGIAKTSLAKAFAAASGLAFKRLQFTQDLLPADVTGHHFYNQRDSAFELRQGAVFTNLLLADEINRAPPKTQSALLEAMEERQVTIEGRTFPLPQPFVVVATMNPIDLEGVYRLPESQLDRFLIRSRMTYLSAADEFEMLTLKLRPAGAKVETVFPLDFVRSAGDHLARVHIDPDVVRYIHAICLATREHESVSLGASPRAVEQLLRAARARALVHGRTYVLPDDAKALVPRVLNHRLILDVEAELSGRNVDAVLAEILAKTPVPKVDAA